MNTDWRDFLDKQGAEFEADRVIGFPNHENADIKNLISDLSHLALIHISGSEAENFLHGQFTINIKTLANLHLQFSAWCNPKGQVKVTFLIYRHENNFTILLPSELKEDFVKKLRMYVMRSDVVVTDQSDELVRSGIQIEDTSALNQLLGSVPEQENDIVINKDLHCLRIHSSGSNTKRYILIGTSDKQLALWKELTQSLTPVGASIWELLDIQVAYPWLSTETTEKFLPQMLNLDLIDGLNYQKGCYPGQEIIARLHFRGQVKRRLYLASCDGDALANTKLDSGTQLYAGDDKSIGTIIKAEALNDKHYLLAVIDNDAIEKNITITNDVSPVINIEKLPYGPIPL